jgi:hypothetical protein
MNGVKISMMGKGVTKADVMGDVLYILIFKLF